MNSSAQDCFEIGRHAYNNEDYYHVLMWMEEALRRARETGQLTEDFEADILEYLAFAMFKQGNVKHALKMTDRLYEIGERLHLIKLCLILIWLMISNRSLEN